MSRNFFPVLGAISRFEDLNNTAAFLNGIAGEGHISLLPWNCDSIVAGTWAWVGGTSFFYGGEYVNSSHNNGDGLDFKAYLAAGTYTIKFTGDKSSNRAITEILIDSVSVALFDLYASPDEPNFIFTDAGNVIASPGIKTIRLIANGKNASSSSYYIAMHDLTFYRTA